MRRMLVAMGLLMAACSKRSPPARLAVSSKVDNPRDLAENIADGRLDTAWNGKTGDLVGAWIGFRVPRAARVRRIELTAGYDAKTKKGDDLFAANHRIAKLRVTRDGAPLGEHALDPDRRARRPARGVAGRARGVAVTLGSSAMRPTRATIIAALLVACTKTAVSERRPDAAVPNADAAAVTVAAPPVDAAPVTDAARPVDAGAASLDAAVAWTDDVVVRELAKSCAWAPKIDHEKEREVVMMHDEKVHPLSCGTRFEQSCVPDTCYSQLVEQCGPKCAKDCEGCGSACAKKCESCKADCTDDACRLSCARACGECRDACVREADRCRTGKCGAERVACNKREYERFVSLGCPEPCDAVHDCFMSCMNAPRAMALDCEKKCAPKIGKCPREYAWGCAQGWHPPPPP